MNSHRYGVTPTGFVPKRMDEIYSDLHRKLSKEWGVNTLQNPQSFLNVYLTGVADRLAELWEVVEDVYHSLSPSGAEGVNLDNAVQFAGLRRISDQKTHYNILCSGIDGSVILQGTIISSVTKPAVLFFSSAERQITRKSCNRATIKLIALEKNKTYTVGINGELYSVSSGENPQTQTILTELADKIPSSEYNTQVVDGELILEDKNPQRSNTLLLGENMTTVSVSSLINFESRDFGKYKLPEGSITEIVTNITGFHSCTNLVEPVMGRQKETDTELRESYIKRISAHAARMTNSIEAAILDSVQGVVSVTCYENKSNLVDEYGRPGHSIEVVVEGGSDMEIAQEILRQKAGGIETFGSTKVEVPSDDSQPVTVCFNRPQPVYAWFKVAITPSKREMIPPNYADIVKEVLTEQCKDILPGKALFLQELLGEIYRRVSGVGFVEIKTFATTDSGKTPNAEEYLEHKNLTVDVRQRISVEPKRIEVLLQ